MGSTGMLVSQGIQAASGVANTFAGAYATRQEAKYQQRAFDFNARMAELQAADAVRRGELAAGRHRNDVRQLIATQQAAFGAQGVDAGSGSAAQIIAESDRLGRADAMTIRGNAFREAYGYRAQAEEFRGRGKMARRIGKLSVRSQYMKGYFDLARQTIGAMPEGALKPGDPLPAQRVGADFGGPGGPWIPDYMKR